MKKNIFFFAFSANDLMGLYSTLKLKYNIIWLVYYKSVYEELKKNKIDKVYFLNITPKIFDKKNIVIRLIKFLMNFFNINFLSKSFFKDLKNIERKYSPVIIFSDTGQLLADYKTSSIKIQTKHSVCYKKYFLNKVNFKYDYLLLPGYYHKKRIQSIYKLQNLDKQLKVVGDINISPFLNKNNFNRTGYMKNLNLDPKKINVFFAPSWNAYEKDFFGKYRILPAKYGDQYSALKKLAVEVNKINCNFIIKLHHLSHFHLKNVFKTITNQKNCYVFKSSAYHDVLLSNDIHNISDIIITDISGVASTGIFLNKKLIFINPRSTYDWNFSDIEKNLRPGFICDNFDEITQAVKNYISGNDPYVDERKSFVKKIYSNPREDANIKIAELIPEILND